VIGSLVGVALLLALLWFVVASGGLSRGRGFKKSDLSHDSEPSQMPEPESFDHSEIHDGDVEMAEVVGEHETV